MSRWADRSHEADRHAARLRSTPASELPTVDILIPTYNEDLEVLERTIVGAKSIDYPVRASALDDGRRDWLEEFSPARVWVICGVPTTATPRPATSTTRSS